jgi:chemotaxis family two-component system response regulator PixG
MMPEANGYEVFTSLKEDPATAGIPFIFLTASVQKKEIEEGFGMGAKGYIKKPFEANELFDTLKQCLGEE